MKRDQPSRADRFNATLARSRSEKMSRHDARRDARRPLRDALDFVRQSSWSEASRNGILKQHEPRVEFETQPKRKDSPDKSATTWIEMVSHVEEI